MKLKVLHCIYDDPENPWVGGGGAVRLRELYSRMGDELEVTILTGRYPGSEDKTISGIDYRRCGVTSPYALSRLTYGRAATKALRSAEYDVAVFDFSLYTPLSVPSGRPVGLTIHHLTGPTAAHRWGRLLGGALERREDSLVGRARCISATSWTTYEELVQRAPGTPIVYVPAGVPDHLFSLSRAEEGYLLYFGRMDWYQKGLDVLLDAVALVTAKRPHLRLVMAGRGKDAERVAARSRELGIEKNVELRRGVSDKERDELFSGASMLLMPSRFEGFGMVAAEAMAAGIPVIAAAGGSLPEVLDAPTGGVLVPTDDAGALAAAVSDLLDDPEKRAALSRSARKSALRYRWDAVVSRHLTFLHAIRTGHLANESNPPQ